MEYLNPEAFDHFSGDGFESQKPFPWVNIQGTQTPDGFARLHAALPDCSLFERKVGIKRASGQAPHDRGILHYRLGREVQQPWREFLTELQRKPYQRFLRRMLHFPVRKGTILIIEWYHAWRGCSVPPQWDARRKLAIPIFISARKRIGKRLGAAGARQGCG